MTKRLFIVSDILKKEELKTLKTKLESEKERIEQEIKSMPKYWLWSHNRWKLV